MSKRVILLDGDVIAFQCASALEQALEWAPGYYTWNVSFDAVKDQTLRQIERYKEKLDADEVKVCLTDPDHNFRLDILPSYKGNRSGQKRPLVLYHLKDWLIEEEDAIMRPGLEGDDVIGILATRRNTRDENIIVSLDKDLKTIPGQYVRDLNSDIVEITEDEADFNHMLQTLSGDVTDGYSGCPGVGTDTAHKALTAMVRKEAYEHELLGGPRKGETEVRYREAEAESYWDVVLSHYEAAGLSEDEALCQARCARILRASDYDFKNKEVKLWNPKQAGL